MVINKCGDTGVFPHYFIKQAVNARDFRHEIFNRCERNLR